MDKKDTWQVTIRFPGDVAERIKQLAHGRLIPPSIVVRQLVKERLDEVAPTKEE